MGPVDFWNLAGRAGRLGREFDGNVFLIDYGEWKPKLLDADRRTPVQPALVRALNRTQDFAAFMTGDQPRMDFLVCSIIPSRNFIVIVIKRGSAPRCRE
jgi:hypothetical protein